MIRRVHIGGWCAALSAFATLASFGSTANAQATQINPYFLIVQDTSGSMTFSTEASLSATATTNCATHNGDATGASCNADLANSCVWTGCGPVTGTCTAAISGQGSGCLSQYCGSHYPAGTSAGNCAISSDPTGNHCVWTLTNPTTGNGECTTRNSCGHAHTRMSDAKCALQNVLETYGDADWGLATYNTVCSGGSCVSGANCEQGDCGFSTCTTWNGNPCPAFNTMATCTAQMATHGCSWSGTACSGPVCDGSSASGLMRVAIGQFGATTAFPLVDYSCAGSTTSMPTEIFSAGGTPLAGSLRLAQDYFLGNATINGVTVVSPLATDSVHSSCRPVAVILLTDGLESCTTSSAAATAATALRSTTVGAATWDIRTHVLGLGVSDTSSLDAIATAGGTTASVNVSNETSIASAFSSIIASSVLVETCNMVDDDCDMIVDEGFTLYCNFRSGSPNYPGGPPPTATLCTNPGEVCDGVDNNCNGQIDEGVTNACGSCGAVPSEVCNGIDDDCDSIIDEAVSCPCIPGTEICNNHDDDCDSLIDEGVTRACGFNVGVCTVGTEICTAGTFGACSGMGPQAQQCNGQDNNCDGAVDRPVQPCGSSVGACVPGSQICDPTTHMFGACVGGVGPRTELCNGIDDDCDMMVDEGDPGGGGTCGSTAGVCSLGVYHCVAGMLMCTGGSSGSAEVCNNRDDDCDNVIDEGIASGGTCGPPGTNNMGQCMLGQLLCVGGVPNTCVGAVGPSTEVCDGVDNNCNGTTDEGNPGGGMTCGSNVGICTQGTTMCVSGMIQCVGGMGPMAEVCNGRDDDCDTNIDEGIPVGAPCGSSVGECMLGNFVCDPATGMLVCQGARGPMTETCNTLDDDCDSLIDENTASGICGINVGECRQGMNVCSATGAIVCSGSVGPMPETCDCRDNNCDGTVDNPMTGMSLCPGGSACVQCQCASFCVHSEFGDQCPSGTMPYYPPGDAGVNVDAGTGGPLCFCVQAPCDATTCATETHGSGTTACSPTTNPCVCQGTDCTFACNGVTCSNGQVCDPRHGACVENDCTGLGCPSGQECNLATRTCVTDPCTTVTCGATQACRSAGCDGHTTSTCCFSTCATTTCTGTQVCHNGTCEPGCTGVTCPSSSACNPVTGMCTINLCSGVVCSGSSTCNPVDGMCYPTDPCTGVHCPTGTMCSAGECVRATMTDAGVDAGRDGGSADGGAADAARVDGSVRSDGGDAASSGFDGGGDREIRELVAGGGCLCTAVGSPSRHTGALLLALALGVTIAARRRRGGAR
jgi:hypothetical protein